MDICHGSKPVWYVNYFYILTAAGFTNFWPALVSLRLWLHKQFSNYKINFKWITIRHLKRLLSNIIIVPIIEQCHLAKCSVRKLWRNGLCTIRSLCVSVPCNRDSQASSCCCVGTAVALVCTWLRLINVFLQNKQDFMKASLTTGNMAPNRV